MRVEVEVEKRVEVEVEVEKRVEVEVEKREKEEQVNSSTKYQRRGGEGVPKLSLNRSKVYLRYTVPDTLTCVW